jgi:formylglycine-generating enzyme required for sulfatase activity
MCECKNCGNYKPKVRQEVRQEVTITEQKTYSFTYKGVTQKFVWIKPGKFMMGSPETEAQRDEDEKQHEVILTKGYWLADTVCTQELWTAVMGSNPSYFRESLQNPVEQVSWDDTQKLIYRLNNLKPELNLCLPTEAQWEYACRAGTTTPFSFGENITPNQVNHNGNYNYPGRTKKVYQEKTVPVKRFPCNNWGLYEMHGNVLEWCADWYNTYLTNSIIVDPKGRSTGDSRVMRGGSWDDYAQDCRSAYRDGGYPGGHFQDCGFRLSREN